MPIPKDLVEQINTVKELEISYRVFNNSAKLKDISSNRTIEIPFESLIGKYKDILVNLIITVNLDDKLRRQYLYNPKLLSYDLYNTTELWAELLRLNNWSSIVEFKPIKIKIYDPYRLKSFLNEILILEEKI